MKAGRNCLLGAAWERQGWLWLLPNAQRLGQGTACAGWCSEKILWNPNEDVWEQSSMCLFLIYVKPLSHRDPVPLQVCRSPQAAGIQWVGATGQAGSHQTLQEAQWTSQCHQGSFAQLIKFPQCSGIKMFPEWQQVQTEYSQQQASRASKKMGTHSYFSLCRRKVFLPCNNGGGHISWRVLT